MDTDAQYERPCKWLLAFAAAIHWVAAVLLISSSLSEPEIASHYARTVFKAIGDLVVSFS